MTEYIPVILLTGAILIDTWLSEPRRAHPLIGIGIIASYLETQLTQQTANQPSPLSMKIRGVIAVSLLTSSTVFFGIYVTGLPEIGIIFELFILYLCIGQQSLKQHASAVITPLARNDLTEAKRKVALLVSRDTAQMSPQHVIRATIESVLENGNDAIFGIIFWYLVVGVPGALAYRIINTLDAMWGYRTPQYIDFGWAAAKLDDLLNWLPARLCAATYALLGHTEYALQCWRCQASQWDSPNAGPVLASGAGALNIQLGGPAIYHNTLHHKPLLGTNNIAQISDISQAIQLVHNSVIVWLLLIGLGLYSLA